MRQFSGGVSVDEGYRDAVAGESGSSSTRSPQPASGAWDEDLGRWGVDDWELPGQGESGARCGEWYPAGVCETCGEVDLTTHTCGKRTCPDCWGAWAQKAAVRAAVRIQAYRYQQPDDYRRQVAHAVVSPPEGAVMNERQYDDGKKKAGEIAKKKGFRGFAVIAHPYRVTDEGKARYESLNPDYGIWVWLRNDVEDMEQYIYWSPHYHIIGPTSADMEPAKESDEWTYSFIRSLEPFGGARDRDSHEDVYGLFRYLLSHVGYPSGSRKQATTWQGDLANNVFVEEATAEWQIQKPSEGMMSHLKGQIEEVASVVIEEEGEGGAGGDELAECSIGDCDGVVIGVFDIDAYLRQAEPPPRIAERMRTARDWRLMRRTPPPGLRKPQTEEQAREALDELLAGNHRG